MEHKTEVRVTQCTPIGGGSAWQVESKMRQLLVDGVFVGYCTPVKGTVCITTDVPDEIAEAAKKAVEEYWGESVDSVSVLAPIESEEEEEDELDD